MALEEVWVPSVTLLALATVPVRPGLVINAFTITILTCEIRFVLSFFTCEIANCPIKHQWNRLVGILLEITGGEVELAFLDKKSIATGIEVPSFGVIIKALHFNTKIFESIRKPYLATPNARAIPTPHIVRGRALG
jgi:hypothetical protein